MSKFLRKSPIQPNQVEIQTFSDHVRSCSVGIDCHRDSYHVYFLALDSDTKDIREHYCKFGVGLSDLDLLVAFLKDSERQAGRSIELIILESTGSYSRSLFELLAVSWPTCMINPLEFSKYGRKTDKFDAKKMALLALQGLFTKSFLTTDEEEQLKILSRSAVRSRNCLTAENNSLASILIHLGFGITRGEAAISLMSASGREIMNYLLHGEKRDSPRHCAEAAKYYNPVYIQDKGERAKMRLEKFNALVQGLEPVKKLTDQTREMIANRWSMMQAHEQTYEKFLLLMEKTLPYYQGEMLNGWQAVELLDSVPSINVKSGMFLICEIGLRIKERFGDAHENGDKRFVSYCGVSPQTQYSADKQTSTRKAVAGNHHVRSLLVECAQSLAKSNHPLGERVRAIERRNGGIKSGSAKKLAVVAGARQLALACYWVLITGKPFDDSRYDYTAVIRQKEKRLERILKDFKSITGELEREDKEKVELVKVRAAAVLAGCPYQLTTDNLFIDLSQMFKGQTLSVLKKIGCSTLADIWALVSANRLQEQVGIGEKRYNEILTTCVNGGYFKHVGQL